jgi:hypothetical protein
MDVTLVARQEVTRIASAAAEADLVFHAPLELRRIRTTCLTLICTQGMKGAMRERTTLGDDACVTKKVWKACA